jgi:hypothetical protein
VTTTSKLESCSTLPLFDPACGELPPPDAVEVYLEPPPSLSLLYQGCVDTGAHPEWLPHLEAAWAAGQAAALDTLLRHGGYLKVGDHHQRPGMNSVGTFLPGHLRITHIPHLSVLGAEPYAMMHDHFYIGAEGVPDEARCVSRAGTSLLARGEAGRPWPVDLYSLRHSVPRLLYVAYQQAIERTLTERSGMQWQVGAGTAPRVVAGCEGLAATFPRLLCPGPPRAPRTPPLTRERMLADAYAAEPDAIEERRQVIRMEVGLAWRKAALVERLVIQDIVNPAPVDLEEDDLY